MHMTQPDIRPVKESNDLYELQHDYVFDFIGTNFVIKKGFRYDGASYAALLFQRDGIHRAAALVHDYLYVHKGDVGGYIYTRKQADKKFKDMLIAAGLKSWHVWLAHKSVRALGWIWWNS